MQQKISKNARTAIIGTWERHAYVATLFKHVEGIKVPGKSKSSMYYSVHQSKNSVQLLARHSLCIFTEHLLFRNSLLWVGVLRRVDLL